jgi:hypothetical protein
MRFLSVTLLTPALAILMCSCSTFQRSSESGYSAATHGGPGFSRDRTAFDRERSANELGLASNSKLSDDDVHAVDMHTRLRRAEERLEGKRERDQYYKNKPYMRNDIDRLEFLALGSFDDRNQWLTSHGVFGTDTAHRPEIQALIEINDITIGMTKQAVRESWGEPEIVEVAGNPLYGNERWGYSEQLPSSDGFQTEKRLVFFEGGKVIGWERH